MGLRCALMLLAVVTAAAQTTLPLKAFGPTLVEIKVSFDTPSGLMKVITALCSVANGSSS